MVKKEDVQMKQHMCLYSKLKIFCFFLKLRNEKWLVSKAEEKGMSIKS